MIYGHIFLYYRRLHVLRPSSRAFRPSYIVGPLLLWLFFVSSFTHAMKMRLLDRKRTDPCTVGFKSDGKYKDWCSVVMEQESRLSTVHLLQGPGLFFYFYFWVR